MRKDLINRIILIISGIFVLISSIFLIILSNISHGKEYIYEGKSFEKNEKTSNYEVINEKMTITFIDDTKLKLTVLKNGEEQVSECLYIITKDNFLEIMNNKTESTLTLKIDSYYIQYPNSEEKDIPEGPIFVCKTNNTLKIITISIITINSIIFIAEIIYHLIDYIQWKKFINSKESKNTLNNIV